MKQLSTLYCRNKSSGKFIQLIWDILQLAFFCPHLYFLLQFLGSFCTATQTLFHCSQLRIQGLILCLQSAKLAFLCSQGSICFSQGHLSMSLKPKQLKSTWNYHSSKPNMHITKASSLFYLQFSFFAKENTAVYTRAADDVPSQYKMRFNKYHMFSLGFI